MRTPALGLVSTATQSAFHINLLAFREVLVTGFGQASKGGTVEPLGLFPLLSGTGCVLAASSHTKVGDALAGPGGLGRPDSAALLSPGPWVLRD